MLVKVTDSAVEQSIEGEAPIFKARANEPTYALLNDPSSQTHNRYGRSIETVTEEDPRYGVSLKINENPEIGDNPNRYKQHGFYFNADNCIACHACEAACSEKNDNPAHIAFRSVGFVEGGSYPAYQRLNISMACNHCDNPVCLKGCPTRAYTKFAEYGAVLQDPDICFGCGYCTWVCPYNAPQLDPVKGQVTKCNMCVDRLEVGLKPACASACLGKALDFGVIENVPEGRTQAKAEIPGFPRTDITNPNIRFQQTRTTQRDMQRVDSTPLKYHRDDSEGRFRPALDPKHGFKREWNLKRLLGSHENAHIAFTLSVQTVMGAFAMLVLGSWFGQEAIANFAASSAFVPALSVMFVMMAVGLFKLNMHLGKPHRFYRGFYNLRMSPVSREIAGVTLFFVGLAGFTLFALFALFALSDELFGHNFPVVIQDVFAVLGLAGAAIGGYFMYKLYRIPARPFWDHWQTAATFAGSALSLGALLLAVIALLTAQMTPELGRLLAMIAGVGLALEGVGLLYHARDLKGHESEGAASFYEQSTTFGYAYWLRNGLLAVSLIVAVGMALMGLIDGWAFALLAVMALVSSTIGRALFYVLVIPTTMPGAFFWKNRGFVEHAREVGLADMPQLGVAYEQHHQFKVRELVETIRTTTVREKLSQAWRIVTG
ncbi:DmsC/YnfH family molybdoenzyme membrane anchor subunit [Candidatus Reidiella endopervernicosa]|uniref:DmsC/YnfH family molybdoenzyme membrane anchor subunit n=1 Tax=Candidatus Reidiella endopervernicosa TaxID=2738883 RepID=UPI001F01A765|nr:DmsC/YnfH family molybdoenzyme membrane anchor subunit [Candidatus Reidiella endopervernicosa]